MRNNFKENLNQKIIGGISNDVISDLQNQLSMHARSDSSDIYETIRIIEAEKHNRNKKGSYQNHQYDYGLALNLFMQKVLIQNQKEIDELRIEFIEKQRQELGIKETPNPNYYQDKEGYYYTFEFDKFIKQDQIIEIFNDGCYLTKEKIQDSNYYIVKNYNTQDSIFEIYIVNKDNIRLSRFLEITRLLHLKKEVVKKVKKIGYCGKSIDFWANLFNLFCTPSETGYYVDNNFNFYRWDYKKARLVRQIREGLTPGAPSISDYEHKDSQTVIRTDYNGAGLNYKYA